MIAVTTIDIPPINIPYKANDNASFRRLIKRYTNCSIETKTKYCLT